MYYLDLELMEKVCHRVAVAHLNKDNDIPAFETHKIQELDSALNLPKQTFGGKDLYDTLFDKAAALLYSLIKNHPFPNGNKRIATIFLMVFMEINSYRIKMEKSVDLAELVISVANSNPSDREEIIKKINNWLEQNSYKI